MRECCPTCDRALISAPVRRRGAGLIFFGFGCCIAVGGINEVWFSVIGWSVALVLAIVLVHGLEVEEDEPSTTNLNGAP